MKKTKKTLIAVLVIVLILVGVGYWYLFLGDIITNVRNDVLKGEEGTRSLVVYFTRNGVVKTDGMDATSSASLNLNGDKLEGNTEIPAKMIQELTGADLYQIYPERYYRSSFIGTALTAWIEEKFNMRPNLANKLENLDKYDVIYVGYPIWWFNAPMEVGTFLESYDLTGKTIVPFCTSQDNSIDISMDYIKEVSKGAIVLDGITANGVAEEQLGAWLNKVGVQ